MTDVLAPLSLTSSASTGDAGRQPIRVLVAEDSVAMREFLVQLLDGDGRFRVVGTAADGQEAVVLATRLRPDVIAMNLHLPRLGGAGATRRIMAEAPAPIVIICTTSETPNGLSFEALQAGAVTVLDKPLRPSDPRHAPAAQELLTAIRLMAEVKVVRRPASGPATIRLSTRSLDAARAATSKRRPAAVVLAASTGGPQAIQTVLRSLGSDLNVPVLVVQHMSPGFLGGMVTWLAATCPQLVRLATHGEEPVGGTVYIAPENHHLLVTQASGGKLALTKAPPVGGFRPSANALFQSAAEYYGARAVGAVLTGMGEDGAAGLAALRAAGASTIAQDEATAVVYGMPRAAAAAGAAERVLPLAAIGPTVRTLLGLKTIPQQADS